MVFVIFGERRSPRGDCLWNREKERESVVLYYNKSITSSRGRTVDEEEEREEEELMLQIDGKVRTNT